jgi:hypothetical protein
VLIDTSSAILLFKTGMIEPLMRAYCLVLSRSVMRELTVSAHSGAEDFSALISQGRIIVTHDYRACLPDLPLAGGERDIVLLYLSGQGEFVIIDDGDGAAYCVANKIPFVNALLVPRILQLARKLNPDEARSAFETILAIGRYSAAVREYASSCVSDILVPFLP